MRADSDMQKAEGGNLAPPEVVGTLRPDLDQQRTRRNRDAPVLRVLGFVLAVWLRAPGLECPVL